MLHKKQRDYCIPFKYKNKVPDNKLFWKVIKPSLSDKSCVKKQINFVEKWKIFETDLGTAEVLNILFGNMVKNLEIDQYPNFDPVITNIKNPRQVLKKNS